MQPYSNSPEGTKMNHFKNLCRSPSSGFLRFECGTPKKRLKVDKENRPIGGSSDGNGERKCINNTSTPFRDITSVQSTKKELTPPKIRLQCSSEPVTPTSNFKMLIRVATSLEYVESDSRSNSSISTELSVTEKEGGENNQLIHNESVPPKVCRKQRSLSFICDRFLSSYPQYPDQNVDLLISIDEVALDLGVERRRMYDIVNVLESIEIVKKVAKNKYKYFGKRNLLSCLKSLSEKAISENIKQQLETVIKRSRERDSENTSENGFTLFKREKTLGATSKKFLMLFLASSELCSISLQVAARVLMGKFKIEDEAVQFKTKIRRLYDIANIFMSVGLIEKDAQHGKQSFKYVGPSVTYLQDVYSGDNVNDDKSVLKYLFPEVTRRLENQTSATNSRCTFVRTKSENWNSESKKESCHRSFVRHSSLHNICAVAEAEREKLYASLNSSNKSGKVSHPDSGMLKSSTTSTPNRAPSTNISQIDLTPSKKLKSPVGFECLSATMQKPNSGFSSRLYKLVKEKSNSVDDIHMSKVKNSETKPDTSDMIHLPDTVINLTTEQRSNILKFLDVSLKDGQVATILISGENNRANQNASSALSMLSECSEYEGGNDSSKQSSPKDQILQHETVTSTFDAEQMQLLVDSDSNTSSLGELNNLNRNSPTPNSVSPISIPSGYATPSISRIGDPMFLPNQEVAEVLNTMEKSNSDFALPSKKPDASGTSFVENYSCKTLYSNHGDITTKTTGSNLVFLNDNGINSDDSTNEEVEIIMGHKDESFNRRKFDELNSKVYLHDEKTISSPPTVQQTSDKNKHNTDGPQFFKQLAIPVKTTLNSTASGVLILPICSPSFSNTVTYLQTPIQSVGSSPNILPISSLTLGQSLKTLTPPFSPICIRPVFKEAKKSSSS